MERSMERYMECSIEYLARAGREEDADRLLLACHYGSERSAMLLAEASCSRESSLRVLVVHIDHSLRCSLPVDVVKIHEVGPVEHSIGCAIMRSNMCNQTCDRAFDVPAREDIEHILVL